MLVAGGYAGTAALASSEIYDPVAGTWTATTGNLGTARSRHTATLLNDGTGRVLVAGGWDGVSANSSALTSAELYDPVAKTWLSVGSLGDGRYQHTATLLPDGKVLVAGGVSSGTTTLSSAEVFDPNPTVLGVLSWAPVGAMPSGHTQHTATLLPNGTVLVAGGKNGIAKVSTSATYNPATTSWTLRGALTDARTLHTATLLPSGSVLVTGGLSTNALAKAELYDTALGTWSVADDLLSARYQHAATLLQNGQLLVTGGYNGTTTLGSAELGW